MGERVYVLGDTGIEAFEETPYDSEAVLQTLIEDFPEILAGEQVDPDHPRRWIVAQREIGIHDSVGAGTRWALDHLLIDQDAVPTLVEVKRSTNPEIRRAIVGQMLEYAAHARFWSVANVRADFESRPGWETRLETLLGADAEVDTDKFWAQVADNLAARHMKLLFVADEIPAPLATVVTFLNEQTPDAMEVLAVEMKQFVNQGRKTFVPRVIGHIPKAHSVRGGASRTLTREAFLERFETDIGRESAAALLDAAAASGATFEWGSRGVSVRARCPAWASPVTVAWLYPGEIGWMKTRYFSFGAGNGGEAYPIPSALRTVLQAYAASFSALPGALDASSVGVEAWAFEPDTAGPQIEGLISRMAGAIRAIGELQIT